MITAETVAAAAAGLGCFRFDPAEPEWFATQFFAVRWKVWPATGVPIEAERTNLLSEYLREVRRLHVGLRAVRLTDEPDEDGRLVYVGNRARSIVQVKYAALLDGYDVRRAQPTRPQVFNKWPEGHHPLAAFDAAGELHAIVMPCRA